MFLYLTYIISILKRKNITEKDRSNIEFGIEQGIDFISASFVRKVSDVLAIIEILEENDAKDIKIISKIENQEGIDNLDEIISVSDGIMVARGDLGVEISTEEIPVVQKIMIKKCNEAGKPVITATQMIDSMMRNPRPTRAEVTDVANAIYDGTYAIMLSGETAAVSYATCTTAMDLHAKAILTSTSLGHTARMVSKFRPDCIIMATTNLIKVEIV